MAGNKQRFTYEINADIGQAKKAINDLQRSIDNLSKKQISTNYLDTGINKAVNSAKELQYHLNKALNADTGKLNLNAFSQSLAQSNLSAKDLMQNLLQGGAAGQQAFTSLAGVIAQSEVPLKRMNSTLKNFATTLKNTIKWEISSTMIHGLERSLRGAVSYAKNLNTSLTNIRIVTGQSVDDMARFAKEANVAAKALSTTTKSYADASLIYYQQGDSQEMAAKKAAITIKAANSSFETSAKEMSEYLTAVWNSYQVGADELERYVDIMASLGAKTATSLEEIATSMQKVAATANTVGVSMEQVSSIIATVSSVTRESAESIGTSYKTIFARIGDLKLGNVDEDGVGLGQVSSQLDAIGVKILDESGNLREMGDIIMDLGTKWQTMNQAQKTAVAQVVAGKRQYTQLMALFENWPMYMQNMQIAESSEGALQKMQDTYAESWQAASDKVKASLESIYGQIFKDQTIIKLMDNTSSLIETIDKVIQGFGGIGGVLKTLGALSITVFKTQIGNSINQVLKNIKMFVTQFKGQNILQIGKSLSSGSAKNVEQLQLQERTKEWSNLFSSMKSTNEVEQIALQNSTSLLNAKDQLIAAEHKLTQAQKDRAVFTLEQLSQEQNKLLALAQERQVLAQQSVSNRKSGYLQTTTAIVNSQNIQRKSAQNILNNVYRKDGGFEKALETYGENAYKITAASNIESTLQSTNNLQAAIEQVRKSLSKHINTDFLEDPKLDAESLRKKLNEVITAAEQANNRLYDKARHVKGGQQQARAAFNTVQEDAEQRYNIESQMTGLERSVAGIKSTFTQLLNPASEASKTLGATLTKVAGSAMSVAGAMSSAGSMVRAFTADTFSLTSALSSFSGVAMNLAMGFSTGGIWGLVATGLATVIGAISESLKVQKELEQKKFEEASSLSSERVSRVIEEEKELQTLLSNYNDLYSRYKAGEEVQNELSASASALADAYGVTGAAVASVTGNFENFNNEIIKTLDLSKELQDAKIAKGLAANTLQMHQVDKNNLQQDFSSLLNPEEVARGIQTAAETATIGDIQSKIFAQNKNLTLTDLIATGTDARGKMVSGSQLEKILSLDPSGFIEFITDIAEDIKGIQLTEGWVNPNGLKSVSYGKKQQYDQDGNRIYDQDEIAGFLSANQNIIGSNTLEDYLEIYLENYLMSTNLNSADLVQAWKVAADAFNTTVEPKAFSSILKTDDQDFTQLFSNNKLMWDNNASINDKIQNFEQLQVLEEHLLSLLSSDTIGENTKNTVSNLLKEVQVVTKDETLSKAVADYQQAAMSEAIFNNAKSLIDQTIGKGVADVSLEEYQTIWNQIDEEVSKNAETYKLDVNADDYEQAKNKVIAGIINDYTILDDWTNVYLSLAEIFTDSGDFEKASAYVKNLKPEEITSDLLEALSLDIGRFGDAGKYTEAVKASQGAKKDKIDAAQYYTKASQVASTYKSGMDLEDATAIYDTFFREGKQDLEGYTKSWDEFLKLDSDARKTYLEGMSEATLKAAREKADTSLTKYTEEQTTFNNQYGAMLKDASLAEAIKDFSIAQDGKILYSGINPADESRSFLEGKAQEYGYKNVDDFIQGYNLAAKRSEEIKQNIISTTNKLKGYELLDEVGDRAIDKITRLGSIVSKLPEDSKEFKKLMDQLPDKVTELDLINMSELERAELILNNLDKPLEKNFTDETTKEVDWGEYYKALTAWKEANQSAVDVILASADAAFTQIENRMNHAKEEAEKIQNAAQILSDSIATGELTETQKIKIPENFLTDWESAADASERAAVAMRMWNEFARQQEEAANEILDTYEQASELLYLNVHTLEKFNFSNEEQGKIDFTRMLKESNIDKALMDVWLKAWDNVKANGKDFTNMSNRSIIETLRAEINNMKDLTEDQKKAIFAGVADNMTNLFTELSNNTIEEAEKATQAWLDAFDAINKAKRTLMSGGNLAEQIAGNPEEFMRLMQNSKYANDPQEFYNAVMSGQITADNLGMKENFPYQALYESKIGNSKLAEYYKNNQSIFDMGVVFNEMGYFSNRDMARQTIEGFKRQYDLSAMTPEEMNDLYNTSAQAHKDSLLKQLGYIPSTDDEGKLVYKDAEGQIMTEDLVKQAYMSAVTPLLDYFGEEYVQGDFEDIFFKMMNKGNMLLSIMELSTKVYQEQAKQQNVLTDVEHKADINNLTESQIQEQKIGINGQYGSYEEYQRLQEAIERAQEAKYSGESWESLSAADQDLLKQYNINFDNVDTSAQNCANALAACAQAAYKLAEQALLAEGTGYTKEDGKYYYTTEDGIKTEVTAENDEAIKALQEAQNFANNAAFEARDVDYQTIERMASSVGLTSDELTNFAATLANVNEGVEDFNSLSQDTQKNWLRIATAALKAQEGWDSLTKSQKDNLKILKKGEEGTTDYIKALSSITSDVKKIFNGSTKVTENFVKDHLDLVEKMSKGDREAAEELERFLLEDILPDDLENRVITVEVDGETAQSQLTSLLNSFGDQFADKAAGFVVTPEIDTTGASAALMNLMYEGAHTAESITNALNAIGWEPIIEYKEYPLSDQEKTTGYAETPVYSMINGTATITGTKTIPLSAQMIQDGFVRVPVIGSGKGFQKIGGGASGAKKPSGSGGGGGGGSQKKETKPLVRGRDEIERYHKQNDTIERLSSQLEEIDKLKDRAYGKDHIAQVEAETDALNKQLIAQQDLHDEALKWMAADKADLAKYGAEYDENGTIVNYERVMERIIDEYNAAIETYNNSGQGDGDKLALEAAEQRFEDAKKAIENYEEALGIANDSANEMLEIQNQMSELEVEKITYELELKMEMNERDLEMLEYYQEKYSEELENQDKLFNTFIQSAAEYEDNLAQLGKAYEDLSRQYAAGLINEAHYAEAVTELQEEIVDNLNSLQEIQSELAEAYSETLELAREEIERTTDAIDHSNEALQSFMDITRLTGNDAEYKKIGKFYDQMYANNLTKIEVQKAHLDSLLEEEERFQEKIRNGQQLTELEKAEYAALSEQIQETRDTLLSSVVESLEVVRESYENTINSIADDLDNFMAGAAGSMEYLQEQYGYFQEEQERYVSTTKELYEVSKLNRDIEGTLATTTSNAAKEALKALQEKINKQSELNELTEYDIEMNQLQYQLLLARIKLEESQNAKDTVRLTRDENGNYAYRYTANQDKIDEAAQHYEDVLQQINDTTVQRTSEIEQQLLNTMSNYKEKFQEIATDYSLTEEERLMRLEELNNQFSETMRYLQEQNNIITNNLTANQEAIAGHYGATMSEITASTAGNVNNTIQSMIDKTEEYIAAMNNAIFGEEGAQSAWQKYLAQLGDIEGSADVAYDSFLGNAQEMGEMNGFAAEEALEVIQTLRDTLDPLEALSSAWDAHNAILEATISNYENLAQVIQGALSAIGQIPNGGTANADGAHRYAKGGLVDYTGLAWVDGTVSDPEMMLNPGDTQNILKATAMVKSLDSGFIGSLVESVKSAAAAMLHMFGGAYHAVTNVHTANDSALDQNVHITAEFPNVQNHTEIEEAFDNLINQAAQFAHRKN